MKGPRGDRLQCHCQILTPNGWGRGRWGEEQPQTLLADTRRERATSRKHGYKSVCWRLGTKSQYLTLLNGFLYSPGLWSRTAHPLNGVKVSPLEITELNPSGNYTAPYRGQPWPISVTADLHIPEGKHSSEPKVGNCSPALFSEWFKRDFRDKSRGYKPLLGKVNT